MSKKAKSVTAEAYPLTSLHIEQLFLVIDKYLIRRGVPYEELNAHFACGTDTFAEFMVHVEKHFKWFDYSQSLFVIEVLDVYILQVQSEVE